MHAIDWMPTICGLTGYEPENDPEWDGIDIWPYISGEKSPGDDTRLLYWNYWNVRIALRYGDWKIVKLKSDDPFELFNLQTDPYEKNDLSQSEPEQLNELLSILEEVRSKDRKGPAPWLEKKE